MSLFRGRINNYSPLASEWRSFFKWLLFVGKLAAPLLWRGAVSLLTEGRGAFSFCIWLSHFDVTKGEWLKAEGDLNSV